MTFDMTGIKEEVETAERVEIKALKAIPNGQSRRGLPAYA
jgi:hypothetical protein